MPPAEVPISTSTAPAAMVSSPFAAVRQVILAKAAPTGNGHLLHGTRQGHDQPPAGADLTAIGGSDGGTASRQRGHQAWSIMVETGSLTGGEGSILGSIIGALIMTTIKAGCTQVGWSNWVQEIATGLIIVTAVTLDRLRHRPAGQWGRHGAGIRGHWLCN